jgi:hypothetical protein
MHRGRHLPTRRQFLEGASAAAFAAVASDALAAIPTFDDQTPFNERLLPPVDEVWGWLDAMVRLGPRHTGSDAHRRFVDSLASGMQTAGLQITRDTYTLPRWDARTWGLKAMEKDGRPIDIPVASYYPYSGQTGADGVTGPLVHIGTVPSDGSQPPNLSGDLKGKIVVLDYPIVARHYEEWFKPFGFYTPDTTLGPVVTSIIAVAAPQLAEFKKAGAAGVIFAFTNISDAHAAGQYLPFGRALQEMPTLWVGRGAGTRLRALAANGATATLTLDADVFPNTKTDTVIATLPGTSSDEVIIVNTHTDGPNAVEENGPVGLLAMAQAFSKMAKSSRQRTLVFLLTTGHFAGAYVPSIRGFVEQHPDIIKKTVGAVTVEHLGCREWLDDASMKYAATGRDEISNAITESEGIARLTLESLQGTAERRVAVVKPTPKGRWMGEGGGLARAGVPTLGYMPVPTYLCTMAPDGCISRLSRTLLYAQITALSKLVQKIDGTPAPALKGPAPGSLR